MTPGGEAQASAGDLQADLLSPVPTIREMGLLSKDEGWILQGERLLVTGDGGNSWQDITPPSAGEEHLLGAKMLNLRQGWVVRQAAAGEALDILRTQDGGESWQATSLQLEPSAWDGTPVASAFLDFINADTGWLALRLQSGSSFSLGRLFATQDGGQTWEERFTARRRGGALQRRTPRLGSRWTGRRAAFPDGRRGIYLAGR